MAQNFLQNYINANNPTQEEVSRSRSNRQKNNRSKEQRNSFEVALEDKHQKTKKPVVENTGTNDQTETQSQTSEAYQTLKPKKSILKNGRSISRSRSKSCNKKVTFNEEQNSKSLIPKVNKFEPKVVKRLLYPELHSHLGFETGIHYINS